LKVTPFGQAIEIIRIEINFPSQNTVNTVPAGAPLCDFEMAGESYQSKANWRF